MNAIFQSHGDIDMKVLLNWAQRAADVMKPLVEELEFKTYKEVGHKVTDMQVRELLIVFALRVADGLFFRWRTLVISAPAQHRPVPTE